MLGGRASDAATVAIVKDVMKEVNEAHRKAQEEAASIADIR